MANDAAKKRYAANTAIMSKYRRIIALANVRTPPSLRRSPVGTCG